MNRWHPGTHSSIHSPPIHRFASNHPFLPRFNESRIEGMTEIDDSAKVGSKHVGGAPMRRLLTWHGLILSPSQQPDLHNLSRHHMTCRLVGWSLVGWLETQYVHLLFAVSYSHKGTDIQQVCWVAASFG